MVLNVQVLVAGCLAGQRASRCQAYVLLFHEARVAVRSSSQSTASACRVPRKGTADLFLVIQHAVSG